MTATMAAQPNDLPMAHPTPPADRARAASLSTLVKTVAGAWLVTATLIACSLVLVGRTDWWRGAIAATVATVMATVTTVPIIAWAMRVGPKRPDFATGAFMAAAAVRAAVSLGAASLAVSAGGYPKKPTMILVVPYYFALLAAETSVLVRVLWTAPPAQPRATEQSTEDNHA